MCNLLAPFLRKTQSNLEKVTLWQTQLGTSGDGNWLHVLQKTATITAKDLAPIEQPLKFLAEKIEEISAFVQDCNQLNGNQFYN